MMNIKTQSGSVIVEYLVGLIFLVLVLLVPVPGNDGRNILQIVSDAIKQEHTGYVNASGLPPIPLPVPDPNGS